MCLWHHISRPPSMSHHVCWPPLGSHHLHLSMFVMSSFLLSLIDVDYGKSLGDMVHARFLATSRRLACTIFAILPQILAFLCTERKRKIIKRVSPELARAQKNSLPLPAHRRTVQKHIIIVLLTNRHTLLLPPPFMTIHRLSRSLFRH